MAEVRWERWRTRYVIGEAAVKAPVVVAMFAWLGFGWWTVSVAFVLFIQLANHTAGAAFPRWRRSLKEASMTSQSETT